MRSISFLTTFAAIFFSFSVLGEKPAHAFASQYQKLIHYVETDKNDEVFSLLRSNPNLNIAITFEKNSTVKTPLTIAIKNENRTNIQNLISHAKTLHESILMRDPSRAFERSQLYDLIHSSFFYAALGNKTGLMPLLLELGVNPNWRADKQLIDGLEAHVDIETINSDSAPGHTALTIAATMGYFEVARFLLENGASVHLKTHNGFSPLMKAASYGHTLLVNLLLHHGARINEVNTNGFTALMMATLAEHDDVVEALLAAGADPRIAALNGDTALTFASTDATRELLLQAIERHEGREIRPAPVPVIASAPALEHSLGAPASAPAQENEGTRSDENSHLCRICLVRNREMIYLPCRHLAVCEECSKNPQISPNCIICRTPARLYKVFQ